MPSVKNCPARTARGSKAHPLELEVGLELSPRTTHLRLSSPDALRVRELAVFVWLAGTGFELIATDPESRRTAHIGITNVGTCALVPTLVPTVGTNRWYQRCRPNVGIWQNVQSTHLSSAEPRKARLTSPHPPPPPAALIKIG